MSKLRVISTFCVAAVLFAVANAQVDTCACEPEDTVCDVVVENGANGCLQEQIPCTKCACVADGNSTCTIETGTAFVLNPLNGTCNPVTTTYAQCPPPVVDNVEGWYLSDLGQSCDSKCASIGSYCNDGPPTAVNSFAVASPGLLTIFMANEFNYACPREFVCNGCGDNMPAITPQNDGPCVYSTAQTTSMCSDFSNELNRACCCGSSAACVVPLPS
mmetsp:Transcript_7424/g.15836  ORF Transcript_7424/g.15836 Transcript_7424/m.15836 type:complete len:217 (+) Transcript_7424:116-766(+)